MLYVSVASSPSLNELHTDPLFFSLFSGVGSGMGALLQHQQHVESSSAKAAPDRSFAVLFGVMMSCSTGGVTASSNVQFNTDIWLVKISSIVCRLSHVSLSCSSRSVAGFFSLSEASQPASPADPSMLVSGSIGIWLYSSKRFPVYRSSRNISSDTLPPRICCDPGKSFISFTQRSTSSFRLWNSSSGAGTLSPACVVRDVARSHRASTSLSRSIYPFSVSSRLYFLDAADFADPTLEALRGTRTYRLSTGVRVGCGVRRGEASDVMSPPPPDELLRARAARAF